MNLLVVFDAHFNIADLARYSKNNAIKKVELFPLLDDFVFITQLTEHLQKQQLEIVVIDTAAIINTAVDNMRAQICTWSYNLGEQKIGKKTIKEWFLLPDGGVSTWWFSQLAEKNTLQTELFFKIAQLQALAEFVQADCYQQIVVSTGLNDFYKSIKLLATQHNLKIKKIKPQANNKVNFKDTLRNILSRFNNLGSLLLALSNWGRAIVESIVARRGLPNLADRLTNKKQLLFISPFPAIDKVAAAKGIFINKYNSYTQEFFKNSQIPVTWLFVYLPYDGYTFKQAVQLTDNFIKHGEDVFMLQEFLTPTAIVKGIGLWLRQAIISIYLLFKLNKKALVSEPMGNYSYPLLKSLWYLSFVGVAGVRSIQFYIIFNELFKKMQIKDCLYHAEMQAWEKALNAAKKHAVAQVRTIGFQHSAFSINYWHLFYAPAVTQHNNKNDDMPLPDILAGNGKLMCELLEKSSYPNLIQVEALRQLYISKLLAIPIAATKEYELFVFGSNDAKETAALVNFVHAAFPIAKDFTIWFKGHPATPIEKIFVQFQIDANKCNYKIFTGQVADCLAATRIVIAPATTVAIEALALGCEVVVPLFVGTMFASPLAGFAEYYHQVNKPIELMAAISAIKAGDIKMTVQQKQAFVRQVWDLNPKLSGWKKLFGLSAI